MWFLALVLSMSVADARPKRSALNPDLPPAPPMLSVAADPGGGSHPYQQARPGLTGRATELDLEKLARVKRSFTIQVDTSAVAMITPANRANVLKHLAADPRWRVREQDGVLVAWERFERGAERSGQMDGFQMGRHAAVRVGVRFDPWPSGSTWTTSPYVLRAPAGPGVLKVASFLLDDDPFRGWSATALSVEGGIASLDVYEAGDGKDRQQTARALGTSLAYLQLVATHSDRVTDKGYVRFAMPRDTPAKGQPWVELQSPERGMLDVRAAVNPGRAGWAWVRLLDEQLQPWEAEAVGVGTRERVGFSADPAEIFYLQGAFAVPRGRALPATAEVWFQPDGGKPERLMALPVQVPRR